MTEKSWSGLEECLLKEGEKSAISTAVTQDLHTYLVPGPKGDDSLFEKVARGQLRNSRMLIFDTEGGRRSSSRTAVAQDLHTFVEPFNSI